MGRLIVDAGVALTSEGVRRDVRIVIDGRRIVAIVSRGASGLAAAVHAAAEDRRIGGPRTLAVPGLVNAHQHGRARSPVALGVPDQPLERWIGALGVLPPVDAADETLRLADRMLRTGVTTTLHVHASSARDLTAYEAELRAVLTAYAQAGVRAVVAADVRDRSVLPGGDGPVPAPVEAVLEVVTGLRDEARAGAFGDGEVALGPPGPYWCSDDLLRRVARHAAAQGLLVTTHLHESRSQQAFGRQVYGDSTLAAFGRMGLLDVPLIAAHGVWLDAADRATLAAAGATVVTNPGSNLRLHAGVAGVRDLLADGVNVALGTDNLALGDREELLDELRLARALAHRPEIEDEGLAALPTWELATAGGGRALGRADVGVLAAGAVADVVLADLDALVPPGSPAEPLEAAVALLSSATVDTVVAAGRVVVEHGRVVGPDAPGALPTDRSDG